jgi:hypothetical protein
MIRQIIIGLLLLINYCSAQTISDTAKTSHRYYIASGLFVPNGQLSTLGLHPSIDIAGGANFKKTNILFVWNFNFTKSQDYYEYHNNDTTLMINKFLCVSPRIEVDRKLLDKKKFTLNFKLGLGFDFLNKKFWSKNNPYYFYSYNINLGIGGIFDLWDHSSLEPFIRYNFVDYSFSKNTKLTGRYTETGIRFYFLDF